MNHYLNKNEIPDFMRRGYSGNSFRARPVLTVTIPSDAGLWSEGSRDSYSAIELTTGKEIPLPNQSSAPWDSKRVERTIELRPGYAIIRASIFCGKDMGLIYYVHPDDIAKLLPKDSGAELSQIEKTVLYIIKSRKSVYRADEYRRAGINIGEIDAIKSRLIALDMLNKSGAITNKGRNAVEGFSL